MVNHATAAFGGLGSVGRSDSGGVMLLRGRHVSRLNSQVEEEEDNIREERYGATALPLAGQPCL